MYIEGSYIAYLAISLAATVWVAQTLHKNGRVFLEHAFHGDAELAGSVNHLLVVGFYLINVGWVTRTLATRAPADTMQQAMELVSAKVGGILLMLGLMHFLNLYVFNRLRQRGLEYLEPPPLPPDARVKAPA